MDNTDIIENPVEDIPDTPDIEEPVDTVEQYKILLMRHAYQKLDRMPLGFGLPEYSDDIEDAVIKKYFGLDLNDVMRETQIDISAVDEGSYTEMMIENRICYYAIKRFRLSSAIFFKFSTATDGKTVDKTNIPKMLKEILAEYEDEYNTWRMKYANGIWHRSSTLHYSNVK